MSVRDYQATMVGLDQQTDLALIKISDSNLPMLKFAESGSYHVGDIVLAIGNPRSFCKFCHARCNQCRRAFIE